MAKATQSKKTPANGKPELTDDMIEEMKKTMFDLKEELPKCQKNASAARRARKATITLEKQFKQFRRASNEHHRKD